LAIHPVIERRGRMRPDNPRDLLTVIEKNQGRNPANAKPLGKVWRRVAVDFHQLEAAGSHLRDLLDDR